jgi:CspA family cold shock protein
MVRKTCVPGHLLSLVAAVYGRHRSDVTRATGASGTGTQDPPRGRWSEHDPGPRQGPDTRPARGEVLAQGTVKWFNSEKGYGFIAVDGGQDLFVHYTAIDMEGYRSLEDGQHVEFEVGQGPKGPQAEQVRIV